LYNNPGANVINGYVFSDTLQSIKGRVIAYAITNEPGQFEEKGSSQIDANGFYNIAGLDPGMYLVQAVLDPNTSGAALYLPTYHLSTTDWEKADPHVLPNMLPVTTDIYLVRKQGLQGSGIIAGNITDPHQIMTDGSEARNGGGLVDVIILLHDEQGTPVDYDVTVDGGEYRFENLPFGTYRLKFDIAGIPSPEVWVTLTANDPVIQQVNFIVDTGSVSTDDQSRPEEIQLYPNPVRYAVNTVIPGLTSTYEIRVIDLQGKVIHAGSGKNYEGILTIDVSTYPSGMYQVHIVNGHQLYYGSFVKLE
jgi:hypothetical protein